MVKLINLPSIVAEVEAGAGAEDGVGVGVGVEVGAGKLAVPVVLHDGRPVAVADNYIHCLMPNAIHRHTRQLPQLIQSIETSAK